MAKPHQGHVTEKNRVAMMQSVCGRNCHAVSNDLANSSVFNRVLKTGNDVDDVTYGGREFHARAAATGSARSPMVACVVDGTSSCALEADRSRRRKSASADRRISVARNGGARPC